MNEDIKKQVDEILESTNPDLTKFEMALRPIFNSRFADHAESFLNIFFSPKIITISLCLSCLLFFALFIISILSGVILTTNLLFLFLILSYISLNFIRIIVK